MKDGNVILTYKHRLLYCDGQSKLFYYKGKLMFFDHDVLINKCKIVGFLGRCSIFSRLLRSEPLTVFRLNDGNFLIAFKGKILNYNPLNGKINCEHLFCDGMNYPLYFCSRDINGRQELYYGEYYQDSKNKCVHVFKRTDGVWKSVYHFEKNSIKHIHNIIWDSNRDSFYIFTGDEDNESGIWQSDSDFKTVSPILIGSQQYRSCFGFVKDDYLFYATDTPLSNNYVYKIDLNKKEPPILIANISGPCIYGTKVGDNFYISTSVEPDPRKSKVKYYLTRKPGPGLNDSYSRIYLIQSECVLEIAKFKKDYLPMALFEFGNILFPLNQTNDLHCVLQSLKPKHGATITIKNGGA